MEQKKPLEITLGLLEKENINSLQDFEAYLEKNEINDPTTKKEYIKQYRKFSESIEKLNEFSSYSQSIISGLDLGSLISPILSSISLLEPIMVLSETFKPFISISKYLAPIVSLIEDTEWFREVNEKFNKIRNQYLILLIKSFTIFKQNLYIFKQDHQKMVIIFGQYYLFLSSIFENFSKKYLQIVKNKHFSDNEKVYRKDLKKEMKKFCQLAKINFYKFYHFLYKIVDFMKHEDPIFYKRYKDFKPIDILKEANEMYISLKLYIKNALFYSYLFPIKLHYSK